MIDLEKALAASQQELLSAFGDNLVSLLVFGSGATADFLPKSSDVNLLVVLRSLDMAALEQARLLHRRLSKYRLAAPLLMTEETIRTSADVFPIEFLEIQEKHRLLHGSDPFADLKISQANLRHECEHELKGRLLRLRESFIETGQESARPVKSLLLAAHNANFAAFRAALRLKKVRPPVAKEEITAALAGHFQLDAGVFGRVRELRLGRLKTNREGLCRLFEEYCREVEKIARIIDEM